MLPLREFYDRSRWGDQWNVLRPNGTRHRGHDIATATHEEIPALRGGTVTAASTSSVLGNFLVVDVPGGGYDFYCHLLAGSRPRVGSVLGAGGKVGSAAGPNDFHGSAWRGVHVHFGSGPATYSVTRGVTDDATALITSVLASPAGGGTTPIEEDELAEAKDEILAAIKQSNDYLRREARARLYRNEKTRRYAVADIPTGYWLDLEETTGSALQHRLDLLKNEYLLIGPTESAKPLSSERFDKLREMCADARRAIADAAAK